MKIFFAAATAPPSLGLPPPPPASSRRAWRRPCGPTVSRSSLSSTEKSLAYLHLLDDHLAENVVCLNPAVKSHQQQQVDHDRSVSFISEKITYLHVDYGSSWHLHTLHNKPDQPEAKVE